MKRLLARCQAPAKLVRLHADQRGAISLMTVLTLLLLVIVLGMVMNVGRQVNARIRMQNAADGGTHSGGVVLARGMNTLAFSNHLLCDVFALTAFLREGREQNAASLVPEILDAWRNAGKMLAKSGFPKFDLLGQAIPQKADAEQKLVDAYSHWANAWAEMVLPTLEQILAAEMIPQFERAVMQAIPEMAQRACADIASRNRPKELVRYPLRETPTAVLWRTIVSPVGGDGERELRTLPVVDPVNDDLLDPAISSGGNPDTYPKTATRQRKDWSQRYLDDWNRWAMNPFDSYAKMSQFGRLWRGFVNGQLKKLLEQDYPNNNLPFVLRSANQRDSQTLEREYMVVGVAYRKQLIASMPGQFHDSFDSDAQSFTQGMLFIPQPRQRWRGAFWDWATDGAGIPYLRPRWDVAGAEPSAHQWDLFAQNWTFHIVPATSASIRDILQSVPRTPFGGGLADNVKLPNLGRINAPDLQRITTH